MSFQVGTTCYSTADQALSAVASAQVGSVVIQGGAAYVIDVAGISAASITYRLTPLNGGSVIQSTLQITPQPCGLLQWQDGLSLGWGVAAAWIVTAAIMQIRRSVHQ